MKFSKIKISFRAKNGPKKETKKDFSNLYGPRMKKLKKNWVFSTKKFRVYWAKKANFQKEPKSEQSK